MVLNRVAFPSAICRCSHYREDHIQQHHKVNGCCDVIEYGLQCICNEFRPFYQDEDYSYNYDLDSHDGDLGEFYGYNRLAKMKINLVILSENIKVVVITDQKSDQITTSIFPSEFLSRHRGLGKEENAGGCSTI